MKPIILRPKPRRLLLTSSLCLTGDDIIGDRIQLKKYGCMGLPTSPAPEIRQEIDWFESFLEKAEEEGIQTLTCSSLPVEAGLFIEDHIQSENSISCRAGVYQHQRAAIEDQLDYWWNNTFLDP